MILDDQSSKAKSNGPPAPDLGPSDEWVKEGGITLLTYGQAADLLQVSDRTVWSLVAEGRIRAVRFGRSVRIDPRDLDDFIRRAKTEDGKGVADAN